MASGFVDYLPDSDPSETQEWIESFDAVVQRSGRDRAHFLLGQLLKNSLKDRFHLPQLVQTPYVNTIPAHAEPLFPGDEAMEKRLRRLVRWNAVVMVLRANQRNPGIGGHLATYASAATLVEVGFNHFFQGKDAPSGGDQIYFQGHAAPGIYARAFLEGRISREQLENFRREVQPGQGLSSYPHPWLMPDFWEFPTVSMGLGPLGAIYQARFNRYLHARGIKDTSNARVWAFLGDGETDEPESLGSLSIAAREKLDNLTFVINCNLQRLDGPVRGNGKIIQELETVFRGAGWNVIKVVWGGEWDPLLAQDHQGVLVRRMNEVVDGEFQRYSVEDGAYIREHFFGVNPQLASMVSHLSDSDLPRLRRGGHDVRKVHAAYRAAMESTGAPTVILAKTVKGWTLGSSAQGRNAAHQAKNLSETDLGVFRDLLQLPIDDDRLADPPFFHPGPKSPEVEYLLERRAALGGPVPRRLFRSHPLELPPPETFGDFLEGSGEQEASTTMVFVRILASLLRHETLGRRVVPIIPDEARTFGMEALFRQVGIYSSVGQLYEPVDRHMLLYYKESKDGQVLEEGITEAGALSSFIAAGTAGANHGEPMIPFYIFYSMFGFQRVGDLLWAAGDQRARGFLLGATAGRTTLNGEGLQHQDGHHHLLMSTLPTCVAYDPAFAFELVLIIQDGLRRMYENEEEIYYYLSISNENYLHPKMPEGVEAGVLQGLYRFLEFPANLAEPRAQLRLFGSGAILREAIRAREILAEQFGVAAEVWSATSYNQIRREAMDAERWNRLHPKEAPRVPYVSQVLDAAPLPIVAASDYMAIVPDQIRAWVPAPMVSLGTDGYGRSDTRTALRRHFEVDAECIALAALELLAQEGAVARELVSEAISKFGIDPQKPAPASA